MKKGIIKNKTVLKIMAGGLGAALACVPVVAGPATTFAATGGKTADSAISWVKSKVGTGIDADGCSGNQCVDLAKAYYSYLGQSMVRGNGSDYAYNAVPSGWSRIKGAKPQKGDVLVYTGGYGGYGHVAIYESDYSTYHQNWNGHGYVERVTNCKYNSCGSIYYWGVIRPDFVKSKSSGTSSSGSKSATTKSFTGLKKVNGVWTYIKNNKTLTSYNGLAKASDGKWYYIKNGKHNKSYTGLVYYRSAWWYVKAGVLDKSYTGLCYYHKNWWYVNKGKVDKTYTGLAKAPSGKWYYVRKGLYVKSFSGTVKYNGKNYTVKKGAVV